MHLADSSLMFVKDSFFFFFFLFSGVLSKIVDLWTGSTLHLPALMLMKRAECSGRKRRREKKREAR
jgi:hypothetical protein